MFKKKTDIDENIINRFRQGDKIAFDSIYFSYCNKLYGFVLKILKSESDSKEIVQEVFVKFWEQREKIRNNLLVGSYLFTIAYNSSIDFIRKKNNEKKYINHIMSFQELCKNKTEEDFYYKELNENLELIINSLPEKQKEVYKLSRSEHLSNKEIAERLTISVNTVENHMSKALNFLRKKLPGRV